MPYPRYLARLLLHVARAFVADGCRQSAAALTYLTLFAVVPFLTVTFTVFSLFPAFDGVETRLQQQLFSLLLPEAGREATAWLTQFTQQARHLTGFGIALLAITAILMLKSIEHALNHIWRVPAHRRGLNGFLVYWAVLSLGPLLIGFGFVVSTYLLSLSWFDVQLPALFSAPLLRLLPLLFGTLGFTLLYNVVPNCPVPWRHAVLGGFVAALGFEFAKVLFAQIIAHTTYQLVYGAFAIAPLFLLWVYICWMLTLAGAELVHALSGAVEEHHGQLPALVLGLALLHRFWLAQRDGSAVGDAELLAPGALLPGVRLTPERWQQLRNRALQTRLIIRTDSGCYVLAQDLGQLPLWRVQELLTEGDDFARLADSNFTLPAWLQKLGTLLTLQQQQRQTLLALPVSQLWQDDDGPDKRPS